MLADNGGPTQTIAILANSPALNAGTTAGLATDQRGVSRPQGAATDIGAFESDLSVVLSTLSIAVTDATKVEGDTGTTPFTFTVTRGQNTTGTTMVNYTVVGTGNNPADVDDFGGTFPSGALTFASGETSKVITVNVSGDTLIEQDETFTVTLSGADSGSLISTPSAIGTIQDDDFVSQETRIFVPILVARQHVIPGDSIPTAIIFQALTDTIVTVTPVAVASVGESIRIVDSNTNSISSVVDGVTTATVSAGQTYSVIFEPQTSDRIYTIGSSAGFEALSNAPPTNIFQPTDTTLDGDTTARDALLVINSLSRSATTAESEQTDTAERSVAFLDVNRDDRVSALDALLIINQLSRQNSSSGASRISPEQVAPIQTFARIGT